jgi:hypothetical protein
MCEKLVQLENLAKYLFAMYFVLYIIMLGDDTDDNSLSVKVIDFLAFKKFVYFCKVTSFA